MASQTSQNGAAAALLQVDSMGADAQEKGVPEQALHALSDANQRAKDSGRSVLMVVKRSLVRMEPSGSTVLKILPPRRKVATRIKRASK
jgi:hypothetical protein